MWMEEKISEQLWSSLVLGKLEFMERWNSCVYNVSWMKIFCSIGSICDTILLVKLSILDVVQN